MTEQEALDILCEAAGEYQKVMADGDIRDSEKNRTFTIEQLTLAVSITAAFMAEGERVWKSQ